MKSVHIVDLFFFYAAPTYLTLFGLGLEKVGKARDTDVLLRRA